MKDNRVHNIVIESISTSSRMVPTNRLVLIFNKINEAYFNRNAIICFNGPFNELNGKSETIFYLSDESEMYCPLAIDELIEKLG